MREPRLTLDDAAAPEHLLRQAPAARLLKAERVQTRAELRPGQIHLPLGTAAPCREVLEVAEAAPALDYETSDAPFSVSRFHLRLVEEKAELFADPPVNVQRPMVAARILWSLAFRGEPREVMAVLFLDTRCRFFGYHIAYTGTLNRLAVEPRQILAASLLANAGSIIVGHNHPSGDVSPSQEDLFFTRRLETAAEQVGLRLVDHLIVASDRGQVRFHSLLAKEAW